MDRLFRQAASPAGKQTHDPAGARCCAACRHRVDEREALEQRIPGLAALSSGFGASVAQSRLCRLHDQLVAPGDCCARFEAGFEAGLEASSVRRA
jgi:hypothetical protein